MSDTEMNDMPTPSVSVGCDVPSPRLWPAVLVLVVQLTLIGITFFFASDNMEYAMGYGLTSLAASLLLILWWLALSRVPWYERLLGVMLFLGTHVVIVGMQGFNSDSVLILMPAIPCLTVGVVGSLIWTRRRAPRVRRWMAVVAMAICVAGFALVRLEGMGGSIASELAWRWTPKAEDLLLKDKEQQSAEPGMKAEVPEKASERDWPAFRGAARDGRVTGTTFSGDWDSTPPKELWRRRVGVGWSSFTVVGNYFFTQEQRGKGELVVCYRCDTGEEVWVNRVDTRFDESTGSGPRATPTFLEGKLYTLGGTGHLQCLDAASGKALWMSMLTEDVKTKVPKWGFASSPLIVGDLLIVFSGADRGKSVLAYHRDSGKLAWSSGDGNHGYSSAHITQIAGTPQLLMISNFGIQSFVPETGDVLWGHAWDMKGNSRIVQPTLVDGDSVLIGGAFNTGTRRLRIRKEGADWTVEEMWATKAFRPYFNDYVLHKGHCYGFDGKRLVCLDVKTGERRWKGRSHGGQLLLFPDMDMLLVLTERGEVLLIEAQPNALKERARFKALTGKTWNHPVVAHGKLFVRNAEKMACYNLPI